LRVQLWSWNYDPEPTAMGPIATVFARELAVRGHDVRVVAAHPHYPPDVWPQRLRPYREVRDGIPVLRLPLWIGHGNAFQRMREEATYALTAAAASTVAGRPDVVVAVSPAFLALAPVMASARLRRRPWILWLQDILPDAAATTGLVRDGVVLSAARRFEQAAYRSASHIVTISDTFTAILRRKGVPPERMTRIYNPATVAFAREPARVERPYRILYTGNIGYSQGLVEVVRTFQTSAAARDAELVIVGHGELAGAVRDAITTDAVAMLGFVDQARLEHELARASIGLVCQRAHIEEFNVPSKLMNLMANALPIWAHVAPGSETARIVAESEGGWVSNSAEPRSVDRVLGEMLGDPAQCEARGRRALATARSEFDPQVFADRFEEVARRVVDRPSA
jgi:colanic acid biosynthesis glycosyl transferase WcaI